MNDRSADLRSVLLRRLRERIERERPEVVARFETLSKVDVKDIFAEPEKRADLLGVAVGVEPGLLDALVDVTSVSTSSTSLWTC